MVGHYGKERIEEGNRVGGLVMGVVAKGWAWVGVVGEW